MSILKQYGLTDAIVAAAAEHLIDDAVIGRIITGDRNGYHIVTEQGEQPAQVTGKFMYGSGVSEDYPAAGDWVVASLFEGQAIIHQLLPRRTVLARKSAGKRTHRQIIAANVDTVFITQSMDHDFNLRRLERYLVMVNDGGAEGIMLVSKQDLVTAEEIARYEAEVESIATEIPFHSYSALDGSGVELIRSLIGPGQTFCFVGSSGVGKSTLINRLIGEERQATAPVREDDQRGRHTTTRRELILLDGGGILIDTPGMREMGVVAELASLDRTFPEIYETGLDCKFRGCTHEHEPSCAVKAAVEEGTIEPERYDSYVKLSREIAYNMTQTDAMSKFEHKRKIKSLTKGYKQIQAEKDRIGKTKKSPR